MVAGFQDDVDLEDKPPDRPLLPTGPVPRENITLSTEEVTGHPKATVLAPQKCSEPETKQYVEGPLGEGLGEGQPQHPDQLLVPKVLHKGLEATHGHSSRGHRAPGPAR